MMGVLEIILSSVRLQPMGKAKAKRAEADLLMNKDLLSNIRKEAGKMKWGKIIGFFILKFLFLINVNIFNIFYYVFSSITFPMLSQKSPIPSAPLPYPPIPIFWPWLSPVLGHIKFVCPTGLSFQ
jgi:quinol-cytochrome oxidoreductase complex cytochrome b subunit